jgi:hypothetical protein
MRLSVVMPVYNEVNTIEKILDLVRAVPVEKEIIIVDDFSSDGSRELLKGLTAADTKVFFHEKNKGKGAALRTGFQHATRGLRHRPGRRPGVRPGGIPDASGPRARGEGHGRVRLQVPRQARKHAVLELLGKQGLTGLTRLLYGAAISDMETCYKLLRTDLIKQITIDSDRFNFEPEITAKLLKRGGRYLRGAHIVPRARCVGRQEDQLARRPFGGMDAY